MLDSARDGLRGWPRAMNKFMPKGDSNLSRSGAARSGAERGCRLREFSNQSRRGKEGALAGAGLWRFAAKEELRWLQIALRSRQTSRSGILGVRVVGGEAIRAGGRGWLYDFSCGLILMSLCFGELWRGKMGRSDAQSRRSLATTNTSIGCDVDYFALPRKRLQQLCKKHGVPANKTNIFMAETLTALLKVGEQSVEALQSCAESGANPAILESCSEDTIEPSGNEAAPVQIVTDTYMSEVRDSSSLEMGDTQGMIADIQIVHKLESRSDHSSTAKPNATERERTSSPLEVPDSEMIKSPQVNNNVTHKISMTMGGTEGMMIGSPVVSISDPGSERNFSQTSPDTKVSEAARTSCLEGPDSVMAECPEEDKSDPSKDCIQTGEIENMIAVSQCICEEEFLCEEDSPQKAPSTQAMEAELTSSCLEVFDSDKTEFPREDTTELSFTCDGSVISVNHNHATEHNAPDFDAAKRTSGEGQAHQGCLSHETEDSFSFDLPQSHVEAGRYDLFGIPEETKTSQAELVRTAPIFVRFGSNNITVPLTVNSSDPFAKNWVISGNFNLLFGGQKRDFIEHASDSLSCRDSNTPVSTEIALTKQARYPCGKVASFFTVNVSTQNTHVGLTFTKNKSFEAQNRLLSLSIPELQFCIDSGHLGPSEMVNKIMKLRRFTQFSQLLKEKFSRMSFDLMFFSGRLRLVVPCLSNESSTNSGVVMSLGSTSPHRGLSGPILKVDIPQNAVYSLAPSSDDLRHCSALPYSSENPQAPVHSFLPTGELFQSLLSSAGALCRPHNNLIAFPADEAEHASEPCCSEKMDFEETKPSRETNAVSLVVDCEVSVQPAWRGLTEPAKMCHSDASSLRVQGVNADSTMESDAEFPTTKSSKDDFSAPIQGDPATSCKGVCTLPQEDVSERSANEGLIEQLTSEYEKERLERRKRLVSSYLEQFKKTPFVRKSRVSRDVAKAMSVGSTKRAKIIAERRATPVSKKHVAVMRPLSFTDGEREISSSTQTNGDPSGEHEMVEAEVPHCDSLSEGKVQEKKTINLSTDSPKSSTSQIGSEKHGTPDGGPSESLNETGDFSPVGRAIASSDDPSSGRLTSTLEDRNQITPISEFSFHAGSSNSSEDKYHSGGSRDVLEGLNVMVVEDPGRVHSSELQSSQVESVTGFLSELLQNATEGPLKHKIRTKQMKHREQFKRLPAFGRRRFLEKALIEMAKKRSAKRGAAILKKRLALAAKRSVAEQQLAAEVEKATDEVKTASEQANSPSPNVLLETLLEENVNPSSQQQGKAAQKIKKHQQQFKTPLKGRSKDKAIKSASKFAAFQRTMVLQGRRGLIDKTSAVTDADTEMVNQDSPSRQVTSCTLQEDCPSPLKIHESCTIKGDSPTVLKDLPSSLKEEHPKPLKENFSISLKICPSSLKEDHSSPLKENPSQLNSCKSPLKDISNSA